MRVTSSTTAPDATLEVFSPGSAPVRAPITCTPFEIGRGGAGPGRLGMTDSRVSRQAAAIVSENGEFLIEDRGQRKGLLVNDQAVAGRCRLHDGDVITFGNADGLRVIFHRGSLHGSIDSILSRLDESAGSEPLDQNLSQLSLLLEATALLQTEMPIEAVLGTMVDQAIRITEADRGTLFEADVQGELRPKVSRLAGGIGADASSVTWSQTAIDQALADRRAFIELDLDLAGDAVRTAASIVSQRLRSVIAVPLYSRVDRTGGADAGGRKGGLLGLLYLDSQHPAAFRGLGRRVLDALSLEAASVLDNARMVGRERERRRMERDLAIARDIQQKLLPRTFRSYGFLEITGTNDSCQSVGGDYFDVVEIEPGRVAFVVADVTGKGLPAALLTAMLQGGFSGISLTNDPARLVNHLNRYVWNRSEANRFATAVVGIVDRTGTLDYINAGHLPALLFPSRGERTRIESGACPIGVFPSTVFTPGRLILETGDTLVLFTDGLTEARSPSGEEFGIQRLTEVIDGCRSAPVGEIQSTIMAAVSEFTGGQEPDDDRTLLIIRYTGNAH